MKEISGPTTLLEAIRFFEDEAVCVRTVVAMRWPDGVIPCPNCGRTEHYWLAVRRVWKCKACHKQFSVKVGTIFEDSPLKLSKWLPAMWMICGAKNGISSYELHRALGVTQKTAWFMLHRIREAMRSGTFEKLQDDVEVDETYIGGKARNMHRHVKEKKIKGTGGAGSGKEIVVGMLERGGVVRLSHVRQANRETLQTLVRNNVDQGCNLYTDAHRGYTGLSRDYAHGIVDHAVEYVSGNVHTNGLENFWSLLKRTLGGTYVSVESFHLHRYLDEQAFRYNERRGNDAARFCAALRNVSGRRITYRRLTGKVPQG